MKKRAGECRRAPAKRLGSGRAGAGAVPHRPVLASCACRRGSSCSPTASKEYSFTYNWLIGEKKDNRTDERQLDITKWIAKPSCKRGEPGLVLGGVAPAPVVTRSSLLAEGRTALAPSGTANARLFGVKARRWLTFTWFQLSGRKITSKQHRPPETEKGFLRAEVKH